MTSRHVPDGHAEVESALRTRQSVLPGGVRESGSGTKLDLSVTAANAEVLRQWYKDHPDYLLRTLMSNALPLLLDRCSQLEAEVQRLRDENSRIAAAITNVAVIEPLPTTQDMPNVEQGRRGGWNQAIDAVRAALRKDSLNTTEAGSRA